MTQEYFTILTDAGIAKLAGAFNGGENISFTKFAVGSGIDNAVYTPLSNQTSLKGEVFRANINEISLDDNNSSLVIFDLILPSNIGGFTVREIGLFDNNNILLAIAKSPPTYKPDIATGAVGDTHFKIMLDVGNNDKVTLTIDPSIVLASRKFVEEKINISAGLLDKKITAAIAAAISNVNLSLEDGSITSSKFADGSITTSKYADGSITNIKLADSMIGKHSIYMPAGAMLATKNNGAKLKLTHLANEGRNINTLDFSGSLWNAAQFSIAMPKSWNAGAVQFQLYWLCDHLTITNGATFKIAACSIGKADSFIKSFGVETSLTSNPTATKNDLIISAISGDLIIKDAGANKLAFFQIYRDVSDSGDTIPVDAKLIGLNLTYTTKKPTDN